MLNKSGQWLLWAALMAVFSGLTLAGRWLDLALALTVGAVIWYGIVPESTSGENSPKTAKTR